METFAPLHIPAWAVAISWLYAGFIWIATIKSTIRLNSSIWGVTFIMTGLLYLMGYLPTPETAIYTKEQILEFRLGVTRLLMILLSVSMWLPITISYFRIRQEVKRARIRINSNGNTDSSGRSS